MKKSDHFTEYKVSQYRSDRFYCINNEWYFAIRCGPDQGPYPSKLAAEEALKTFLAEELALQRRRQAEQQIQKATLKPVYQS